MQIKYLFACLVLSLLSGVTFAKQTVEWHVLGTHKVDGISGIAAIDAEHFLVVHDRKKVKDPRLGLISWKEDEKPVLTRLNWCDEAIYPVDLEAITSIPGYEREYLILESIGKATRIKLHEDNSCEVITWFMLPTATSASNMEGLNLYCFENVCVLAWAERGSSKTPAKFSWTIFDPAENELKTLETKTIEFSAPYPKDNRRSITAIAIDKAAKVWVSAAADGGDEGPFESAIYNIGSFVETENQKISWKAVDKIKAVAKYEKENIKIEGLLFTEQGLIIATEDEDLGGKITLNPFK